MTDWKEELRSRADDASSAAAANAERVRSAIKKRERDIAESRARLTANMAKGMRSDAREAAAILVALGQKPDIDVLVLDRPYPPYVPPKRTMFGGYKGVKPVRGETVYFTESQRQMREWEDQHGTTIPVWLVRKTTSYQTRYLSSKDDTSSIDAVPLFIGLSESGELVSYGKRHGSVGLRHGDMASDADLLPAPILAQAQVAPQDVIAQWRDLLTRVTEN